MPSKEQQQKYGSQPRWPNHASYLFHEPISLVTAKGVTHAGPNYCISHILYESSLPTSQTFQTGGLLLEPGVGVVIHIHPAKAVPHQLSRRRVMPGVR